jgi:predicted MFS family arabinose efflux permease
MILLVNLARVVFAPLVGEFIGVFDIGEGTAGLIVTMAWVGSASLRIPTGWLLTRVPRHWVVLGTGGILTAAAAFTATTNSVPTLGLGALLMGLASGAYFVAANPLVSELYPERVGRAMGIHGMASQVGAVVAAPFVTLVLATFASWRGTFVGIAVAAFLATVAFFVAARRADLPDAGSADRDLLGAVRSEWRLVGVGVVVLGLTGFVWQGLFNFYELYMQAKGLGDATAKNMLTIVFGAGVPAFIVSGRLADRFPHVPYILSIVTAFVLGVLLLTVVEGLVPLLVVTAGIGFVIHSLFPALDTYLLGTLPDDTRASAYAVYSGLMMVIQASGSSVVGALVEAGVTYDTVFTALALGLSGMVLGLGGLQRTGRLPQ